jgi:hypothetical protein
MHDISPSHCTGDQSIATLERDSHLTRKRVRTGRHRKLSPTEQRASEVLAACAKLEHNLRNLRALLMSRGEWRAITALDAAWLEFADTDLQIKTDWVSLRTEEQPAEQAVIPLCQHNFTHLIREPRLKKVSA